MPSSDCMPPKSDVKIRYITPRDSWYDESWKGNTGFSGGIGTNIGYHIFDLLIYIFGDIEFCSCIAKEKTIEGVLEGDSFSGEYIISTDKSLEPEKTFIINGIQLDLQKHGAHLYLDTYRHILDGTAFTFEDAILTLTFCERIRNEQY